MIISYYLPPEALSNRDLADNYASADWTEEKIYKKIGVKSRHIVQSELVSDLAVAAAEGLIREHRIDRSTIDFLLLCTQSPDYFLPPTSCIVQQRLGLSTKIGAYDYNLGCSGYVFGLATAKGLLLAGIAKKVLLITSETYSRYINRLDRSTRTVFGDAASATLLETDDIEKIGEFVLGTDGSGAQNLIVPAGACALPHSDETAVEYTDSSGNIRSRDNIYMNGPEIFSFTLRTVPESAMMTLEKNHLSLENVDYVIMHQASRVILDALREKIGVPKEKFCVDFEDTGNTVSSTIPIALQRSLKTGKIQGGMKVLLMGFGVGYSWGGVVLTA